jgi:hypothetical protein
MCDRPALSRKNIDGLLKLSDSFVEECLKRYLFLLSVAEGLNYIQNHSENKVPYTLNIFEWYDSDEPTTSLAMAEILKYKDGGAYPLLELFIQKFLVPIGFDSKWIENPVITAEKDRIDICVKDNKYAIIFENKVKGANYQPNQLARYIHKLNNCVGRHYSRDNIFIVLMPTHLAEGYVQSLARSIWRLPMDYHKPKSEQRCVTEQDLCWCDYKHSDWDKQWDGDFCKSCIKTYKRNYEGHAVVLQHELADWLIKDCARFIPTKEYILKSFVIQFADFLNLQYGTRENQKLKREMEKYLREKLFDNNKSNVDNWNAINEKLSEIEKLKEETGRLLEYISCDVIDDWYGELLPSWKCYGLRHEKQDCFFIDIQGVRIGCWNGINENTHQPYWGFHSEKGFTQKQHKMIEAILGKAEIGDRYIKERNDTWYWNYTCNGAEICNDFYDAAIELGYIKKLA